MNYRPIIATLATATMLAGCTQAADTSNESDLMANPLAATRQAAKVSFTAPSGYLYVSNRYGYSVYEGPSLKLVRNLFYSTAGGTNPAVNSQGQVYLANFIGTKKKRQWAVSIFTSGAAKQIGEITRNLTSGIRNLAVSPGDNLYVSMPRSVALYRNSNGNTFKRLVQIAQGHVAFDSTGNAYVGTFGSVNVYPPGQSKASQTITNGVQIVKSIAVDAEGNLYVGSTDNIHCGDVTVYQAGTLKLLYTITDGVCVPDSLAFDSSGNLYVANAEDIQSVGDDVTVYAPGSQEVSAQIGSSSVFSVTLDSANNVYVSTEDAVNIYAAGSYQQVDSISSSSNEPLALVWGPK